MTTYGDFFEYKRNHLFVKTIMKIYAIVGIVVITIMILLLVIFAFWIYRLRKPSPGRNCKQISDWMWDDSCLFIQEKFHDPSIKSPSKIHPNLTGFRFSSGAGNSIFLPCWYRFRYVNVKTGGYSNFSEWTQSPVISGSCCLPCPDGPGKCPSTINRGYESCTSNQPTIGVDQTKVHYNPTEPQPDGSFIYMNLHRYVSPDPNDNNPPPENINDEIVGYLLSTSEVEGQKYYSWIDVLDNPCKRGCSLPSWCQTKSICSKEVFC